MVVQMVVEHLAVTETVVLAVTVPAAARVVAGAAAVAMEPVVTAAPLAQTTARANLVARMAAPKAAMVFGGEVAVAREVGRAMEEVAWGVVMGLGWMVIGVEEEVVQAAAATRTAVVVGQVLELKERRVP